MRARTRVLRDRRGVLDFTVEMGIAMIITVGVLFCLILLVGSYKQREVDTTHIEPEIYLSKLYFSPQMLNELDGNAQIVRTGVIDLNRFTTAELDKNNYYYEEFLSARLTLMDENYAIIPANKLPAVSGVGKRTNPIYNNQATFEQLLPFARQKVKKAGGATMRTEILPVIYELGGEEKRGYLEIIVVRPNS